MDQDKQIQIYDKPLIKNLQAAITGKVAGDIELVDTSRIDRRGIKLELKKFKTETGSIDYPKLFDIPREARVIAMVKQNYSAVMGIVTVALTYAMEGMNLKRGMNPSQILDLAEEMVDAIMTEPNDNLALEDIMLFLQKLTRGGYGNMFESIDIPKVMNLFDVYRDERWEAARKIRDEKEQAYKDMGDSNYHDRHNPRDTSSFGQMMEHYKTKAQIKRDEKRERKNYDN